MAKKNSIQIIQSADEAIAKATIQRQLAIEKALQSSSVDDIWKAQNYLSNIQKKQEGVEPKSMIIDPQQAWSAQGYKNKSYNLSYEMLRAMARTIIIKPIIETRKEQVIDFCEPQKDKYSTGFIIQPRKHKSINKGEKQDLTPDQERRIEYLTEFILNCGTNSNEWHGDNFHSFTRKFIQDSLSLDQGTFEIISDKKGVPLEFLATDGATFRIADSFNDDEANSKDREEINGYHPYYVQVYQGRILEEFYPWELCFGIRNPQSNIYSNGYGRSELEDLIDNVTSMLNADQYNSNYFKVGSNPKGIIKVSGNINPGRMEEFKSHWQATMTGVRNAHKLAVIEADKMDFISTQQSNKDMEWGKYFEFLIKIGCAHYKIDPAEINFPLQGSSEGNPMFEGNNEHRLQFSKDKGLKPLLKAYQHWLNKYIIHRLDSDYELSFQGLEAESPEKELNHDILAMQNFMTVNEIRIKRELDPIEGGDVIANPILAQQQMMKDQMAFQQNQGYNNPGSDAEGNQDYQKAEKDNPIAEALNKEIEDIFNR